MPSSLPAALARCDPSARAKIVASLDPHTLRLLNRHFPEWAHEGQLAPPGDWRTWVLMAGRGFGKTRAGAEWVMGLVRGPLSAASRRTPLPARAARESPSPARGEGRTDPPLRRFSSDASIAGASSRLRPPKPAAWAPPSPLQGEGLSRVRIALVAASLDEARRVMVEGPSGILAVARPGEIREWSFARRRLVFAGGAEATLFSGAHPEGLRGPEHDFAWCDELAKWRYPQEAWDNLQLGLRRPGTAAHPGPRALVTTTPRRGAALSRLLGEEGVVTTGGASGANPHLPDGWAEGQAARLTALLARQEIGGELLTDVSGALWPRALIEASRSLDVASRLRSTLARDERELGGGAADAMRPLKRREDVPYLKRVPAAPPVRVGNFLTRIVVGVDPPAGAMGDACGIVVCGLGEDGVGYVLADASAGGLSPDGWARKVAGAAAAWGATLAVAEANNGGDMIASVLKHADAAPSTGSGQGLPVKLVHARRGKVARAAAVAAWFESGRAKLAGRFPELEDELAGFSYDGPYAGPGRSPDRADAMVWALDALLSRGGAGPGVRGL